MFPTHGSLLAVEWLSTPMLWTVVGVGSVLMLGIGLHVLRKRRTAAMALVKHPFAKYIFFSVLAHVVLAAWLLTSRLFDASPLPPGPAIIVVDVGETPLPLTKEPPKPWDDPPSELAGGPVPQLPQQPLPEQVQERPETAPVNALPLEALPSEAESFVHTEPPDTLGADITDTPIDPAALVPDSEGIMDRDPEFDQGFPDTQDIVRKTEPPKDAQQLPTLNEQPQVTDHAESHASPLDHPVASPEEIADVAVSNFSQPESPTAEPAMQTRQATLQSPVQAVSVSSQNRLSAQSRQPPQPIRRRQDGQALPVIYRDRWLEDRLAVARARGGSEDTEAAVGAALAWLAKAQGPDGRWDASQFGSGRPVHEGGHNRGQTGLNADTATTGLALLAFLGSGHTHLQGEYADTVRRGLDFLVRAQQSRTDGSLVGTSTGYAAMYCHGIATLSISEAYSLTGDESLRPAVRDAIGFTLAAQHRDGGWRYRPQEPGDTSQLGWQLMALTSAHYGGFGKAITDYPTRPWTRASRFVDSVSWGNHGGLASYRPNMRPTRAMTAEALLCRLLLNTPTNHPRVIEAADHLMGELPGDGRLNYYYWYYGTLGLYHLQDDHWQRWNRALTRQLLQRQHSDGSWPTENSVWGNAGGTVYTTALSAMTLEVYYRYRPFAETNRVDRTARRP